jgi:hypothetical protein
MKRRVLTALIMAAMATPLFAGALLLEAGDPKTDPEAVAKHAVVLARITACHSPEKTVVSATAEGLVGGKRQSIPVKVMNLSTPGAFAVARQWPREGVWTIRLVATNPDYKDYATGMVVPLRNDVYIRADAMHFTHAPTEDEVNSALKQATLE